MIARPLIDPGTLLARAVVAHARALGSTVTARATRTRPWASATYDGEQVELAIDRDGADDAWLLDLPEAELAVRGYFVADLAIGPVADSTVTVEALLIRAA